RLPIDQSALRCADIPVPFDATFTLPTSLSEAGSPGRAAQSPVVCRYTACCPGVASRTVTRSVVASPSLVKTARPSTLVPPWDSRSAEAIAAFGSEDGPSVPPPPPPPRRESALQPAIAATAPSATNHGLHASLNFRMMAIPLSFLGLRGPI